MDYTPGGFDNVTKENFTSLHGPALTVMSTRTHQIAMFVVYESEFQIISGFPSAYEGQKELEFLKRSRRVGTRPASQRRAAQVHHHRAPPRE